MTWVLSRIAAHPGVPAGLRYAVARTIRGRKLAGERGVERVVEARA